jgi:hypothetical protein
MRGRPGPFFVDSSRTRGAVWGKNLFVSSRCGGVEVLVDSSRTHNQQDAGSRRRERGGGVLLTAVGGREGPLWETHILRAPQEECFFLQVVRVGRPMQYREARHMRAHHLESRVPRPAMQCSQVRVSVAGSTLQSPGSPLPWGVGVLGEGAAGAGVSSKWG